MALNARRLAAALRELIAALDRRMPQHGRDGEPAIARESASLRKAAVRRLGELRTGD
jgi:hypothetical protein